MRGMSEKVLKAIERRLDKKLQQQTKKGLSTVFKELGCRVVARDIKVGRNVTKNAAFGFRLCLHDKIGPRYDPISGKFFPMTARNKQIEKKFEKNINGMLEYGGYKKMPSNLIPNLRKKDKAFEKRVKKRRK